MSALRRTGPWRPGPGLCAARLVLRLLLGAVLALGLVLVVQGGWTVAKARLAQRLLDRAFALDLATGRPHTPWPWADTRAVARIEVPRLGISQVVLESGSGQALAFGPGHLSGSGDVGSTDTAVFVAHRDTHFRFLGDLGQGDLIRVTRADGRQFDFRVTDARVVAWNGFTIDRHPARPRLELATCWPIGAMRHGPLRLVVTAEAVGRHDEAGR